jgi:hypothetical protein
MACVCGCQGTIDCKFFKVFERTEINGSQNLELKIAKISASLKIQITAQHWYTHVSYQPKISLGS